MASNKGSQSAVDLLKQLREIQAKPKTTEPHPLIEDQWLKVKAKYANLPDPKKDEFTIGDILRPVQKVVTAPLVAAGKILEVASIPRRFLTSGLREAVDVLDSDSKTTASFDDLFAQTGDKHFGFGKAFPMKGNWGRVVGFIGDTVLDPINWWTLGGAVSKTATFTARGGKVVSTRNLVGRTTLGRNASEKLAQASFERMGAINEEAVLKGGKAVFSKLEMDQQYLDVAKLGKAALHPVVRKDLGIKNPGLYFLGKKKLPGTTGLGSFLESGLASARVGIMGTKFGQKILQKTVPTGTARIAHLGEDFTRDARIALRSGKVNVEEAEIIRTGLNFEFARRLGTARGVEDAGIGNVKLMLHPTIASMSEDMHLFLDNVVDPSVVAGATTEKINAALITRAWLDEMQNNVQNAMRQVVPDFEVGYIRGYYPHMVSDDAQRLFSEMTAARRALMKQGLKKDEFLVTADVIGGEATVLLNGQPVSWKQLKEWMGDALEDPLSDKARIAGSFQKRNVIAGQYWFGVELTEADLSAAALNRIAKDSGLVNFDIYETALPRVLAKYAKAYGEQMGFVEGLGKILSGSPQSLKAMQKVLGIDKDFLNNALYKTPQGALQDTFGSLQHLSQTTGEAAKAINLALREINADPDLARILILSKRVDSKKLNTLKAAIDKAAIEAKAGSDAARANLVKLRDEFDAVAGLNPRGRAELDAIADEAKKLRNEITAAIRNTDQRLTLPEAKGKTEIDIRRVQRKTVGQFVSGRGVDRRNYETLQTGIDDGIRLIEQITKKDISDITVLDNILVSQFTAENRFWAANARRKAVDIDAQYLRQTLALLESGEANLRAGFGAVNADGEILRGIPAIALVMKNQLREGWTELSSQFPGLETTPEFHALWSNVERFGDPIWMNSFTKTVAAYTKFHKSYAVMTPGFHVRNAIANVANLVVHGADLRNIHLVTPYYVAWRKAAAAGIGFEDFVKTVPDDMKIVLSASRDAMLASGGGIYTETFKEAVGASKLVDNPATRLNFGIGQASDDYFRFVLAADSIIRGQDVGIASARVMNAFFDYEDVSSFDRAAKQLVPFWLWTSRNLQIHLSNMIFNPRPYLRYETFKRNAQAYRLTDESYVPKAVEDAGGFELPVGDNLFAVPDLGFTRVQQQLDQIIHPKKYVSQLQPMLRVGIEEILGKNFYTGKDLEGASARLGHIAKGMVVTSNMMDQLFLTEGQKQSNTWLSFLGMPWRGYGPPTK